MQDARLPLRQSHLAIWLLIAALMMRMLIPAGLMPAEGNGAYLQLCSATGAGERYVDFGDSDKAGKGEEAASGDTCAFAGLGGPMLPALAEMGLQAPSLLALQVPGYVYQALLLDWLHDRWPPSQGPPAN